MMTGSWLSLSAQTSSSRPASIAGFGSLIGILSLLAVSMAAGGAQARVGPPPASLSGAVPELSRGTDLILPYVDEARYLREDQAQEAAGIDAPRRFAAPIAVRFTPLADGVWDRLADGGRIWRLRVLSTGARSLNFGIGGLRLPPGALLYFYASGSSIYDGPYTAEDVTTDGQLWTAVIHGDAAVLELDVPADAGFEPELTILQVGHDYRGFGQILQQGLRSGTCNNDVVCPVGDPWRAQIRSEGDYTLNGQWTCSGQMVNSNDPTHPPYFLTAYHCGLTTSSAPTIVVYWRFESPQCGDQCCGPLTYHQSGSSLKARYSTSDFCLARLNADPQPDFRVYYSGWDAREENSPDSAVCIHHPNNDEKSISFTYTPLTITTYLQTGVPGNGTHWRVHHWDSGTTEPGSSGSGLWDMNRHLVGQLHGGYASCTSITSDWFGRFSQSWNGGGQSNNRLKDWLDPGGTETLVLDGWDPASTAVGDRPSTRPADRLLSILPNPAQADFQVGFRLRQPGVVSMDLFDAAGRIVSSLPAQGQSAGDGTVQWRATGANGAPLAPGAYFVRLRVDGKEAGTRKLIFVR